MAYANSYSRVAPPIPENCHLTTPLEEYDFNSIFDPKVLRSDRLELRPFIPSLHAKPLLEGIAGNPELTKYLGVKWASLDEICRWAEGGRRDPTRLHHAIYTAPLDKPDAPADEYLFAGTVGQIESNYDQMISEVGWLCVLTPFHRTHVTTHTVGLLMHRILDAPEQGGLGLRRCQWKANSLNLPSHQCALVNGYTFEGVLRALVVLPPYTPSAHEGRPGVRGAENPQRDTWMASVLWYEWEEKVREHIDKRMARRA